MEDAEKANVISLEEFLEVEVRPHNAIAIGHTHTHILLHPYFSDTNSDRT